MIGEKRWGSLPAKLCLAEFCKDLPITNGFSLTHLLSSCSFYMWIIIRTTKCVLIFSIVYLQEISQIWAWDSSIFFIKSLNLYYCHWLSNCDKVQFSQTYLPLHIVTLCTMFELYSPAAQICFAMEKNYPSIKNIRTKKSFKTTKIERAYWKKSKRKKTWKWTEVEVQEGWFHDQIFAAKSKNIIPVWLKCWKRSIFFQSNTPF